MSEDAIVCHNFSIAQGTFGMENINMQIKRGYITGLIGRNGSGKTTLIKGIAGVLNASNSNVVIENLKYYADEPEIRRKISVMYDNPNFSTKRIAKKIAEDIAEFDECFDMDYFYEKMKQFDLNPNKRLQMYSAGMLKKFMLIITLARRTQIIILDEPTSGVDPVSRIEMLDLIQEFMENENHTVLFSTHITSDLDKIADYVALTEKGKILFLKEKEELKAAYKTGVVLPTIEEIMCHALKEKEV